LSQNNPKSNCHWYLLQTKFRQERKAAQELEQQNINVFLPLYKSEKINKGVRAVKEEPLFSRYLFIELDIKNINWTSIRSTRGVSKFVEFGNGASIVDPLIIAGLRNMESQPEESYLTLGEKVRVVNGAFKGLEAIYQAADGLARSYILMELMQQDQFISIDNQLIEKI
jgi:transcriptional antiterminator RfaH